MNKLISLLTGLSLLFLSCAVLVNDSGSDDEYGESKTETENRTNRVISTRSMFPFENNSNWWKYSEVGGTNTLNIEVTDTISDDLVLYYRVVFQEHRVDTTDDWFKRVGGDIKFGTSLVGGYDLFLPSVIDSKGGVIVCGTADVDYTYYDSIRVGNGWFKNVVKLQYEAPVLHGFEEIWIADSFGIIIMIDKDGRWPVSYLIDSCNVGGILRNF